MAQAADSPIGFHSTAKVPHPGSSQPADGSLADLHACQASPAGLAAAQIFSLVSIISDLNKLAASPLGLRLLFSELPGLKSAVTEIDQLLSRIYGARGKRR
jgi:hypothetical protein